MFWAGSKPRFVAGDPGGIGQGVTRMAEANEVFVLEDWYVVVDDDDEQDRVDEGVGVFGNLDWIVA